MSQAQNLDDEINLLSRLNRIPATRSVYIISTVLIMAWIVEAFDVGIVSSLMIILTDLFNLNASSQGILGASAALGVVIGLAPSGYLADRYGRKKVLLWGVAWFGVFTLAGAVFQIFPLIVSLRFIAGIGEGAVFPIPYMIISEIIRTKKRATSVGALNGALLAAYFFPGVIGSWAISQFEPGVAWRVPFIIGGLLPIVLLPLIELTVPESPRWLLAKGRNSEVTHFVQRLEREANIPHDTLYYDPDIASVYTNSRQLAQTENVARWVTVVKPPYLTRSLVSWATFGSANLAFYVILVFFPTIFVKTGIGASSALFVVAVMALISGIGSLAEGVLADRLGRKPVIFVYALLSAIGIVLVGYSHSTVLLFAAGFFAAFCGLAANSITKVYITEQYPTRLRGIGSASGEAAARLFGSVLAVYYIASLLSWVGVRGTLWVVGIAVVALVVPATVWGRETGGISLEESGSQLASDEKPEHSKRRVSEY